MANNFLGIPKISVVTVNFNQGKFLERTIQSVLSQQYPNLEYIIIDGSSTDGSVEIIKKYAHQLSYWCSEPDQGQYDAINKGFARSTGEILAFLNADDVYLPWTLATVASVFSSLSEVQWLTSLKPNIISGDGEIVASGSVPFISKKAFLQGKYIPGKTSSWGVVVQEGTFWRRNLWEKAGARMNTQVKIAADFDLWCRFIAHAEPIGFGFALAAMSRHEHQRSNQIEAYVRECDESLQSLKTQLKVKKNWLNDLASASRSNRLVWALMRRIVRYESKTVDPEFSTEDFSLKWRIKNQLVF